MSGAYKVGAELWVTWPDEPDAMTVVIDKDGDAWQNRPGPGVERPWKSVTGEEKAWEELLPERGKLKVVHLGGG
jgi:hypothetical protein